MQCTLPYSLALSRHAFGLAKDLAKSSDNLVVVKRLRIFKIPNVSGVSSVMLPTDRLTILLTMACLSSSNRVCARVVQEKLCQFVVGKNQLVTTASAVTNGDSVSEKSGTGAGSSSSNGSGNSGSVSPVMNRVAKRSSVFSGVVYPLFTSGGAIGVEALKYGPCGIGVGSVRNFYSSSLVRNLFKKNQPSSSQILPPATHPCMRGYSSVHTQQPAGPIREYNIDPYILLDEELKYIFEDIRQEINRATNHQELKKIAVYYFDGQGKAIRPMVAMLMAKALNYHMHNETSSNVVHAQRQIAMIAEMIHTASLVHDDVIDQSFARRGKPSVNVIWNHKKVTQAGDYVLAIASMLLARLKHDEVTHILSQVLTDLVQGEFMQLGSKETENERFAHYFTKTYRKTASLIANSLKAVAVLSGADEKMVELSFQYGRNLGLAFQYVDDLLDFVSSSEAMGKPAAADLKLGLATAPVLFACEKFPELNPMILRRFREPGDVERAYELVHKSQGLEQTRFLAREHCIEALRLASQISESPYQKGLIVVGDFVLNRMK
ncbi:all trans-polyprenyl-diphosphate synthase PDSS1 isoform X1 [Wyeomyia smithii]|uniref:all trans-polyprenyl-diphosphate synthase PDSS1 isoform X1 n=1 Tax=Wyeomyia smithii TaxID=174621 RepID=UPI002468193E|nr:all trans-polyprenyl-diphosphate synthase PDSS1 isoform X1 [Wyeomyia smithii]XP_055525192.1 all trans-polyprenyl-diphosphate synthase PDSS1 isoform X1 [Wyeomyia smithii]XP_055525194.1 all trans-polyprenyl-diphosphate synthase PDSS1 isoform X1 [Wyeomyia smithii]